MQKKWIEDGNMVDRGEVLVTLLKLQKLRLYRKALQFVEWLEATKCLNFTEYDYASHLDLVAKVHGLQQAETYINKIPESFRGEIVYRTFLANCVSRLNVKKAVEVFNTIRDVGLPISTFSCDQLLLLYKRVDKKKVSDVLVMMEKESIKPSIFTYRLLIELKGNSYDINGIEQIVEKMKAEGMWPDLMIQSMVVEYYIFAGFSEKAEAALKEMEGDDIKENRDACKFVLPLYASLDKASDVERVWKVCEAKPRRGESLAAIEAWGEVGCVDKAEEVFEKTLKLGNKVSSKFYDALLRIYAKNKLLFEGEDLVKRMKENGYKIGPSTCDALVNLYVGVGEVNKADLILQKEARKNGIRPLHSSYMTFLKEYAKRGDVNNAENVHQKLRQAGFRNRMKLHELLLEAYLNARIPAYGFRERMKADNIFPNKKLAELLAAVDEFRMTQIAQSVELDDSLSYLFKTPVAVS
ncbi:pentatricopeptide repeat-containing protein At1g80270, mitochondrial-like isoform X2 [Asparagus officinalis]|uniref:pentatricopeptide repeat-containing protein At1g80270, mitochondrial-like isoform X2 n=1 Tax=Asparagus officinalis TaxID=4686 RepID=UPI00098E2388|nr:pentatricopeptide repeat-containing protein At1g80270, mitochondrial-like isoform X2 [Asparagus officinalis]